MRAMDRFDEIWRNRFQQEDISPEKWNTPSDSVWKNIQQSVNLRRKKRRRPIFILLFLLGLFAVSGAVLYFSSSGWDSKDHPASTAPFSDATETQKETGFLPSDGSSSAINESKNLIEGNAVDLHQDNSAGQIEKNGLGEPVSLTDHALYSESIGLQRINQSPVEFTALQKLTNGLYLESGSTELIDNALGIESKDFIKMHSNLMDQINEQYRENANIYSLISTLPFKDLTLLTLDDPTPYLTKNFEWNVNGNKEPKGVSRGWKIGLAGGMSIWNQNVSNSYTGDLSAFDFNYRKRASGWFGGIELSRKINDYISFSSGLFYERVEGKSAHNTPLKYSPGDEDPVHHSHDYNVGIATPFGFASAEFLLNRKEFIGQDPVDLLADFESRHRIENLSIPLYLKINPLGKTNGPIPLLSVGMGVNRILAIRNSLYQVDPNHSAFEYRSINTRFELKDEINRFHLDLRLGLDVEIPLSEQYDLSFGANAMFGLNKIFDSGDYYTRVNRLWIQATLRRSLGKK